MPTVVRSSRQHHIRCLPMVALINGARRRVQARLSRRVFGPSVRCLVRLLRGGRRFLETISYEARASGPILSLHLFAAWKGAFLTDQELTGSPLRPGSTGVWEKHGSPGISEQQVARRSKRGRSPALGYPLVRHNGAVNRTTPAHLSILWRAGWVEHPETVGMGPPSKWPAW